MNKEKKNIFVKIRFRHINSESSNLQRLTTMI